MKVSLPPAVLPNTRRTSDSQNSVGGSSRFLADRFRLTEDLDFAIPGSLSEKPGYFQLGSDITCYGHCASGVPSEFAAGPMHDALPDVSGKGGVVQLPFDPAQLVDNLRCERYVGSAFRDSAPANQAFRNLYYFLRPLMPVLVRRQIQKLYFRSRMKRPFPAWPVDSTVESIYERLLIVSMQARGASKMPFIWFWPDGAPFCTMITHDVETAKGVRFCPQLMDLNDSFGIKTSFHFVPEQRYQVSDALMRETRERGFEIDVHDLNHDGHLFRDYAEFLLRAQRINHYSQKFGSTGFRSAVMYRNVDWLDALNIRYDMSIPNAAHLDPQSGGCCTILPFFIGNILELPTTATQDYSLFHILHDYSTRLWQQQVEMIATKHGLASFVVHPDYIIEKKARRVYSDLLRLLSDIRANGQTWIALPNEIDQWWRLRSEMNLVPCSTGWKIVGEGSTRARVAWVVLENDRLNYEF